MPYDLTDPAGIAANQRGELTDEQRQRATRAARGQRGCLYSLLHRAVFPLVGLVLVIVLVTTVGFVGWTRVNRYAPTPAAAAVLPSAQTNGWLVFKPAQPTDKGFIFYPGGLVDAQAYAPLARQIAERGILTVIVPMPLDLAIFNFNEKLITIFIKWHFFPSLYNVAWVFDLFCTI